MSLETEIVPWTLTRTVWTEPIRTAFAPEKLITDPAVYRRICFDVIAPDLVELPHLVWSGPFDSDNGNVAIGSVDQKIVKFYLTLYGPSLLITCPWLDAILEDIRTVFNGTYYFDTPTGRLNAMLPGNDRKNFSFQGVVSAGKETPLVASQIDFTIGWQS